VRSPYRYNFFKVIFFMTILIAPADALAALNLSVTPIEGGSSLRFGRVSGPHPVNREVKIRINSSDGQQYQVFQRLVEPLAGETGRGLDPRAVETYALSGSNSSGTLYLQHPEGLNQIDQLLYTSDPAGGSDSFTMVYTALPRHIQSPGSFFGRIQYLLRPLGGGPQQNMFLNVYLEGAGEFRATVEGTRFKDTVRLDSEDSPGGGYIRISFEGNPGQRVNVYQDMENFPQTELFEEIDDDVLQHAGSGGKGRWEVAGFNALPRRQILVYSSEENEDSAVIDLRFNPETIAEQTAGLYRGRLKYIVEASDERREYFINLEAQIAPVFKLEVQLPPEGVRFNNILPANPPETKEVLVAVRTNLGRPYMVVQKVSSNLTNAQGDEIPQEHFNVESELPVDQPGRVTDTEYGPVGIGETTVFFSDQQGSSSRFFIRYRLKSYPEIIAGDYSAPVVFSLVEM
jgi:hypothetical protein